MKRTLALAALAFTIAAAPAAAGDRLYAISVDVNPTIVSFDSSSPGTALSTKTITGAMPGGAIILGMDTRPRGGGIYVVTLGDYLYSVDPATGGSSRVATLAADPADSTSPFTGLEDTAYAVDFDPVSDRLRLIDATNASSMSVDPVTGLVVTDSGVNPGSPHVTSAAYSNNVPDAASTTLYGHDFVLDDLEVIAPQTGTATPVGAARGGGTNGSESALDIAPSGTAYATEFVPGLVRLFTVDLSTGGYTLTGDFPSMSNVAGLAASTDNLVSVASATEDVSEGAAAVTLTLVRQNPRGSFAMTWSTGGGTATPSVDYTASGGALNFADGQVTRTVTIPLVDDTAAEPDETFDVTFAPDGNQNGTVLTPKSTVTIRDDDLPAAAPPDRDRDGVPDASDNCPNVANADQADGNGNGVGKACDLSEVPPPIITAPKPGRCANAQKGTAKDDGLVGTAAGDLLNGGGGADALFGGAGDDCLTGDAGDDWLSGGDGNDDLKGGAGNDLIYGGNGNDTIDGGSGVNVIKAGAGNDTVKAKNKKRETIDCGPGKDKVTADKTDKLKGCETKT